jgi:hypothetical protein
VSQQPGPSKIHVPTIETENEEFSFDDSVEEKLNSLKHRNGQKN